MTHINNSKVILDGIFTDASIYVPANTTYAEGTVLGRNSSGKLTAFSTDNNASEVCGEKANGELTFTGTAEASIPIRTQVKTSGDVVFETLETKAIPTGETTVTIPARAVAVGTSGNIAASTTLSLVESVTGISAVVNSTAFKGGVDASEGFKSEPLYVLAQAITNADTDNAATIDLVRVLESGSVDKDGLIFVKAGDKTNVEVLDSLHTNGTRLVNVEEQCGTSSLGE